ncbi:helix-turn-helix transcriptional regulator [Aureimonas pseudogalii]|uniref:Transcriptional regulator with XRE-family HTH domain n=1 Tax=Aureimonas pseudogalii TaxID=1744844 RepID=A0A7W6H6K7_9HYPH|nr:helix-turn-helix transcriptional regulator [Aureimonas pseudogalii]MBB3999476.1 transcriptional regulator with XRE-family HTH domain [Aureimonas pseudogalii]
MSDTSLGGYLRERRGRLDPAALGFAPARRRTPGLRREEVAARAHISATWYAWLEQGRGGAPSADVLDRLARALMLTEVEREHLFLLGLGRLPDVRYRPAGGVTPRLQRVLDAMDTSPALIRNVIWDVVAWNRAAAAMLTDYSRLPPEERNVLRLIFLDPRSRAMNRDWEGVARFVVGVFRADAARAGAVASAAPLVEELRQRSPEFAAFWDDGDVQGFGEGVKHLRHPVLGEIAIEYSAFAVDGRPDLSMLVYNPTSREDAERIRSLLGATPVSDGAESPA